MMISGRAEGCTLPFSALVSPEVFLLVVVDALLVYVSFICIALYFIVSMSLF